MRKRLRRFIIFAFMNAKKITIHDIAAKLGMSASTISRSLSDNNRISKETRKLVRQTASEMGYSPNILASSFRKGKSKTIGIVIPRINRHFFSYAIAGMEQITNPAGYNLMICQTNESFEEEKKSIQTLINNQVDGIIMSISVDTKSTTHIKAALAAGVQVVQFDRINENLNIDKVLNDNFMGGYEITRHLICQGCRKIIHIAGPLHNNVYSDRCAGYRKAMEEAGIDIDSDMIVKLALTREAGQEYAKTMIENGNLPDAIFSASDYSALGILIELKKQGIAIPQQISVAGFANEPFTEYIEPSMTTAEQHALEMGRSAANLLIERLSGSHEISVPRTLIIKTDLITRKSTTKK